jgi:hypothetical protein
MRQGSIRRRALGNFMSLPGAVHEVGPLGRLDAKAADAA